MTFLPITNFSAAVSFVVLLLLLTGQPTSASATISQEDTVRTTDSSMPAYKIGVNKLIVPSVLIAYGSLSFAIPSLKQLDISTRNEILHEQPSRTVLDNYTQYAPAGIVFGLSLAGYKGKNTLKDQFFIYTLSQLISGAIVVPSKNIIREPRPDGSNNLSFPSGHAGTAFSSAHFMYREYRDQNIWLSLSGYPFAMFSAVYRLVNNRHWVTDVIAGAGVGILSTELAYWLYPKIYNLFDRKESASATLVVPTFTQGKFSLALSRRF